MTTPDVLAYPEARILNRASLRKSATESGNPDLTGYVAECLGDTSPKGRERAAAVLDNRDESYITVYDDREERDVEALREGLKALSRLSNRSDDIIPRIVAGEIAGDHRHLQSVTVTALLKAVRLLATRPAQCFDGRNEWIQTIPGRTLTDIIG